nr:hypothetical protein [Tanacetum cinerariifolium]
MLVIKIFSEKKAVSFFFSSGSLPPSCNSSFIVLIPKTHEAKTVKDFRPISLIGIFSMVLLSLMSFYLSGCLNFAMGSILKNGSPTTEFKFSKGLNVVNAGLFKGIHINGSLSLSHLFYADDVIFICEWNLSNISTIVNVLKFSIWLRVSRLIFIKIDIIREVRMLSTKGIDLLSVIIKQVGNGETTSFWDDVWLGDSPLKLTYPRLYFLEFSKHASVASKLRNNSFTDSFRRSPCGGVEEEQLVLLNFDTYTVTLSNICDRWTRRLDSLGVFSVKSAREFINDYFLPKADSSTRWVKYIPIKINIYAWRVSLDKLPSRLNLSLRGLDIPSILCPLCSIAVESTSNLLFACHLARHLVKKVTRW